MLNRTHSNSTTSRRRVRRTLVALTLTTGLGVSLAACGDDSHSGHSPSGAQTASNGDVFNDADVAFATDMVQHHAQALVMVDMTAGRDLDPKVAQLTEDIRAAQGPEIEQMTDWLTAWDQEVPETMRDHANAHDMDGMGEDDMGGMDHGDSESAENEMPGMMSAEDMDALENASDAEFQDMWLEMMVEHHQGAIEMAQDEVDNGTFDDAVAMAENIISGQQDEIDQMEELLG
ncbi:DUF305 domain-containing protein [Nocardioides pyridinolyticus]